MVKLSVLCQLLRVKQWIKNLFVLLPLFFSGKLFTIYDFLLSVRCLVYFCIVSSIVYVINDLCDLNHDRAHPEKSKRPIASGKISVRAAVIMLFFLFGVVFFGLVHVHNNYLILVILGYVFLNLLYSFFLKNSVILDSMSIAMGFELRVWAGAVVIGIIPSVWLQIYTFLLALLIGFAKRRAEIVYLRVAAAEHRRVLAKYRLLLLDQFIAICAGIVILAYSLYTISADVLIRRGGKYMIYTVPFIIYMVFRYLYLIYMHRKGGDPTEIVLSDFPLILAGLLWLVFVVFILYI